MLQRQGVQKLKFKKYRAEHFTNHTRENKTVIISWQGTFSTSIYAKGKVVTSRRVCIGQKTQTSTRENREL